MMKCFGYVRVSTSKQGEGVSLDEQREAIERYASKKQIEIVQWFEEEKTAAKRGRPEFNRMLELLRDGEADGVVIHKIDRSSRNLKDWAELGDLIDEGIEVHFAHEGFDLDSRAGRLSADIQAVVAADYIRNLRAETKKGFYGRLKQGIYPLPAPVGYEDIGPGEPKEIDPVEGPLVRQAFELYATGDYGLRDLAEEMTERGLTNRDGGPVTRNGLSTMLNNPFYYGLIRIKKTGETFEGAHEPLIPKTLFDQVQRILNSKAPGKENRHRFIFRKLFECAQCGYSMIGEKQKGHIYYRCHTSNCPTKCVREETLDEAMRGKLRPLEFTESERAGTLFDLKRFLVEEEFRREFLETVSDPQVRYYWRKEFSQLRGKPQTPLLTRLNQFLSPKPVRYMVCQRESPLDLGAAMEEGNVVLVKLAQGAIGASNAALLGALLVAKFHQLALARQRIRAEERRPFYLYIDEFQHFVTPSMAQVLSEARKYRLGLTLAHQELTQLRSQDPDVASAVLTHPCTRVCFRVGSRDARTLAKGLAHFEPEDLQQLSVGEAVCRIERADADFNLRTHPLPEVDEEDARRRHEEIVRRTRERYATLREEVAADLEIGRDPSYPPAEATDGAGRGKAAAEERPEPSRAETDDTRPAGDDEGSAEEVAEEIEKPEPGEPPAPLGRGGERHRYLQNLLKRHGEDWGYHVTIEQPVLDGTGSVDLALKRNEERIACEISITSGPGRELKNVRKCLEAGFDEVVLVAPEAGDLAKLREGIRPELSQEERERVRFLKPDRFVGYLEERAAQARSGEQRVGGYKVDVQYRTVDEGEKKARSDVISKIVTNALQRLSGE